MLAPRHIAITGAGGQIGYSLLFHLARGQAFGPQQPVILKLLELPEALKSLEGLVMELQDGAFPLLAGVEIYSEAQKAFDGANWVLMVGSKPRGPGMERKDLLQANGPIFVEQGKALEKAQEDVRVVVVGNPCNTNALIAMSHARSIPQDRFSAMTALDENRARNFVAKASDVAVGQVENVIIWGNHSTTMYPDLSYTKTPKPLVSPENFVEKVRQRGAAVIEARGKSSAASAASACIDHIQRLTTPSQIPFSAAVSSKSNPFGIPEGLIYSFPIRSTSASGQWTWSSRSITPELKKHLDLSAQELLKEKDQVSAWLG